jgi:hypothetical protein
MAPLRSLGNILSAFDDFYARTGKDAVKPFVNAIQASGGTTALQEMVLSITSLQVLAHFQLVQVKVMLYFFY